MQRIFESKKYICEAKLKTYIDMIKKFFLTLLPLLFGICAVAEEISPKANPQAEVVMGNARFTVLTPRLVRMEWAADGKF